MHSTKGYLSRLPPGPRSLLQFTGDLRFLLSANQRFCGSRDTISGGDETSQGHIECRLAASDPAVGWRWRNSIALSGNFNLTKKVYEKYMFEYPTYVPLADVKYAIYSGNKKVFQYVLFLAETSSDVNNDDTSDTYAYKVCKHVLFPLIKLGANDWLEEFLSESTPKFKQELHRHGTYLMARAMCSLDPNIMGTLFHLNVDINPDAFYTALGIFTVMTMRYTRDDYLAASRQFHDVVRATIVQLRDEYPHRKWDGCDELTPYNSEDEN